MNKTAEKEKLLIDVRLKASKQQLFDLYNKKKKEELKPQVLSRDMSFVRLKNFMIAIKEAMSLTDITELALQSSYFQKLFEELIVDWQTKPANYGNISFIPDVFDRPTLGQLIDDDEVKKAADVVAIKKAKETRLIVFALLTAQQCFLLS